MAAKRPLWLVKLLHFEYWSWWAFYLPLLPWYLYLVFKTRSFTFFTNVDPGIEYGGFFGESKMNILKQIDKNYLPRNIFIEQKVTKIELVKLLEKENLTFPVIAKPNIGERGRDVTKIENIEQLNDYQKINKPFIIQEFISFDIELGVLYNKMPDTITGQITSITKKKFLTVTGNGKETMRQLMEKSDRARFQLDSMSEKWGEKMEQIVPLGIELLLEPIGNHCRGTAFLDYNHLINNSLNKVFDKIANTIEGFHYGRFDMKVKSLDDLLLGKNIRILELNGVSADPAHIYDPNFRLITAYKDVAKHWGILAKISNKQSKKGIKPIPFKTLWPVIKNHFFS